MRARTLACLAAAATAGLTACSSVTATSTGGAQPHLGGRALTAVSSPPAGSRAEAAVLAAALLTRLHLPAGARRLPAQPVPRLLGRPILQVGGYAELDVRQLFALRQPMSDVAAELAAARPAGMAAATTCSCGFYGAGVTDISFADVSLPRGIYLAQLVLTVAPAQSGGSLLRADAQVIWFRPRTAAEYIDAKRYRALTITTFVGQHKLRKLVTSPVAIARLAGALDRSPAQPVIVPSCPAIWATYRMAFSASPHSKPAVVVTATQAPCEGVQVTAAGRVQPPLQDDAAVVLIAVGILGFTTPDLIQLASTG